jgi:uncharacterized membrane protein YbhN (UPF0104 family)
VVDLPTALLGDAFRDVAVAMGRTRPGWLLAAITLHVGGQVCRGIAWQEVLRPTWPEVTRRRVCRWHVCGAGLTGVLSPRGGDAARIVLARRELPGATCAALAGSLIAEGTLAAACGLLLTLAALTVGLGATSLPPVGLLIAAAAVLAVGALLARCSARVRRMGRDLVRGAAILRRPQRFVRRVLPWEIGNRVLRLGSVWCFLQCVGLPAGIAVVLVACAAQSAGNSVPLPVANVATATGALVAGLPIAAGGPVDVGAVAAFAMVAPVTLTLVGLVVSAVLARGLLRPSSPIELLRTVRQTRGRPIPVPS